MQHLVARCITYPGQQERRRIAHFPVGRKKAAKSNSAAFFHTGTLTGEAAVAIDSNALEILMFSSALLSIS